MATFPVFALPWFIGGCQNKIIKYTSHFKISYFLFLMNFFFRFVNMGPYGRKNFKRHLL